MKVVKEKARICDSCYDKVKEYYSCDGCDNRCRLCFECWEKRVKEGCAQT